VTGSAVENKKMSRHDVALYLPTVSVKASRTASGDHMMTGSISSNSRFRAFQKIKISIRSPRTLTPLIVPLTRKDKS